MSWGGGDSRSSSKGGDDWRKKADTHMMSPEEVKAAGVEASKRPPGHHPGEVLHQRRRLPYSYTTMTLAGLGLALLFGYVALYAKKRPDMSAGDVARDVSTRTSGGGGGGRGDDDGSDRRDDTPSKI